MVLPSMALMLGIPAQVAGCGERHQALSFGTFLDWR